MNTLLALAYFDPKDYHPSRFPMRFPMLSLKRNGNVFSRVGLAELSFHELAIPPQLRDLIAREGEMVTVDIE